MSTLDEERRFWTAVFQQHQIAKHLAEWADQGESVDLDRVHVTVTRGSTMGDNFMSDTFAVEARETDTGRQRSTFVKVLPSNSLMRTMASQGGVHQREIGVYRDFFDALLDIRGDLPIPLDVPGLYYCNADASDDDALVCLAMENLKTDGYRMVDKVDGCDYQHARIAVSALAHYHSLTMAALRRWADPVTGDLSGFPDRVKFITEKSVFDHNPVDMVKDIVKKIVEFTKEMDRPDVADWMQDIQGRLPEIVVTDTLRSSGPLACILHGDFWNNNMLFKYDGLGRPVSVKMVDFQIARIGNPLNDLLYFFYSSTQPGLRAESLMNLLHHYLTVLRADLKLLQVDLQVSWSDFVQVFKRKSIQWMIMGGMVMTFVLNKESVDNLKEADAEAKLNPQQEVPWTDEEKEKGISKDMEKKMADLIDKNKFSSNPLIRERLMALLVEVKALQ